MHSKIKPLPARSDTDSMVRLAGIVLEAFQYTTKDGKVKSRATVLILSPTALEKRSMKRQSGSPPVVVAEVDCEHDRVVVYARETKKYIETLVTYKNANVPVAGANDSHDIVIERNHKLAVDFDGPAPTLATVIEFYFGLGMWLTPLSDESRKGASVMCFANGKNPKEIMEREDCLLVSMLLRAGPSVCTQRMPTFDELCVSEDFDPNEPRTKKAYSREKFLLPITANQTRDRVAAAFALAEPGMAMRIAPRDVQDDKSFSYAPSGTQDKTLQRTAFRFEAKLSQWPSLAEMTPEHVKTYQLEGAMFDTGRTFYIANVNAWKDLHRHFTDVEGFLACGVMMGETGQTASEDPSVDGAYVVSTDAAILDVPTVLLRDALPVSHRYVQHMFANHKLLSADKAPGAADSSSKVVKNLTEMDPDKRATFLAAPGAKHYAYRALTAMEVSARVLNMQVDIAKECEFKLDANGNRQPLCEALLDGEWDGDVNAFHARTYGDAVPTSDSSAFYRADHPFLQNQMLSMTPRVSGRAASPLIYVFAIDVGLLVRLDGEHYGKYVEPSELATEMAANFKVPAIQPGTDGPPQITEGVASEQSSPKRALENGDAEQPSPKRAAQEESNGEATDAAEADKDEVTMNEFL